MTSNSPRLGRRSVRSLIGAAAAAVLVAGGGAAFAATGTATGTAAGPATAVAAAHPAAAHPALAAAVNGVQVVAPHQGVDLGRGGALWLDRGAEHVVAKGGRAFGGSWTAEVAAVPLGQVSMTVAGDRTSSLVVGMYRGVGAAERVTVVLDGRSYPAHVVTLAGHPGWSAFYLAGPGSDSATLSTPAVTVYGVGGKVLARFAKK
jgi:hypothetical protein